MIDISKSEHWGDVSKVNKKINPEARVSSTDTMYQIPMNVITKSIGVLEYSATPKLINIIPISIRHKYQFNGDDLELKIHFQVK